MRRFREEIPPNSLFAANQRALFAIPQEFAQNAALVSDIRASVPFVFRFTKDEPSSAAWQREMKATKDQLSFAIQSSALGQVSELRLSYISIAEEFLELLAEYGGKYSAEQAKQERSNIFESWSEIGWLVSDLRELIEIASATNNRSILGDIAFLPFAISSRAVHARDHFLFQQFFGFASLLYFLARQKQDHKPVQEWLVDRSSRWPLDICQFYILPILESDGSTSEELSDALNFAKHSLRVYQDLLKAAADDADTKSFALFLTNFERLYKRLRDAQPQSPLIRIRLQHLEAGSERELQEKRLLQAEKREGIAVELNQAKYRILLALGGRVLARILAGKFDDRNARHILELIQDKLPTNIDQLTTAYTEAAGFSEADFWGWDQWDLIADGQAHFIDTFTNLNQMYALHAIRLLSTISPSDRSAIKLSPSSALADLAGEQNSRGIIATLEKVKQNIENWQTVLPELSAECIEILRSMLLAAAEKQKAIEEERVRNAELDNFRVEKFKREVIEHFFQTAQLRSVFTKKGIVELKKEFSSEWLGYNQLDEKEAFIAEPPSDHVGWGQAYGEGLARSEDQDVFKKLINAAGVKQKARSGSLVKKILDQLDGAGSDQLILLHSLNYLSEQSEFERISKFIRRYDPNLPPSEFIDIDTFTGVFVLNGNYHPMFRVHIQDDTFVDKVLLIRADTYMRWQQLVVRGSYEPVESVREALSIDVVDLNANSILRNEIIESKPSWLSSKENAEAYLRSKVVIKVREAFQIDICDPKAGICIDFRPS